MRSVFIMAKIQTVGKISEFVSGEYKEREAQKRSARKKKLQKVAHVASSMAIPVALGSPLGALAVGVVKASSGQLVLSSPDTLTASTEVVTVNASKWAGEKSLEMIAHALDPIVDVLVALSFPVASVVIVGGCFWFMFGNSERAWRTIQNGALGYVLIQMSPLILNVLKNIGGAI
jgi:cytochrome bd-type quinol oxidase subunit 2